MYTRSIYIYIHMQHYAAKCLWPMSFSPLDPKLLCSFIPLVLSAKTSCKGFVAKRMQQRF